MDKQDVKIELEREKMEATKMEPHRHESHE
jgi:hypothetical protein